MAIIRRYDEVLCEKVSKQALYEIQHNFEKTTKALDKEIITARD